MADSTKLVLTFVASDGKDTVFVYNYAKEEPTEANVNALMDGIIANGAIFHPIPVAKKAAKIVVTNENDVEITITSGN